MHRITDTFAKGTSISWMIVWVGISWFHASDVFDASVLRGPGTRVALQDTEDVVVTRRTPTSPLVNRKGTITEWKGSSLTLSAKGRERDIDNQMIVEIQTDWNDQYQSGLKLFSTGRIADSIAKFRAAIAAEHRPWAKRTIRADLVQAYLATENYAAATNQFLQIVEEDPQTRFFHLCPLPWVPANNLLQKQSEKWIISQQPVEQLIGASWRLTGRDQEQATRVLEMLARTDDERIKPLATAQLWRLRAFDAPPKLIALWKQQILDMPARQRAGPWFVLATAQSKTDQKEAAIVNMMRIPILFPEQPGLSAAALYQAGKLLSLPGKATEANTIWNELRQKYPDSIWAQQAPR